MSITATCPACNTRYQLADTLAGKRVRCKSCSEAFFVRGKTAPNRDEDSARIQSSPRPMKQVAWDEEDEDTGRPQPSRRPRKKRRDSSMLPLVIGGCIAAGVLVLVVGGFAVWALGRSRQLHQTPVAVPPPQNQPNFPVPPMAPPANQQAQMPPAQGPLAVELTNGKVSGFGAQMEVEVDYRFTSGNPAGRRIFLMIKATHFSGIRQNYYLAELRNIGGQTQGTVRASGMSFGIEHGPFELWIGEGTPGAMLPLITDRDIKKISNVLTVAVKEHSLPGIPGMPRIPGTRPPIGPPRMRP